MYQDLTEHVGSLTALLGVLSGMVGFLIWRMLARLDKKLEEIYRFCCDCRPEMLARFVTKDEFRDVRDELRKGLSQHCHSSDGEIVRFIPS